MGQSQSPSKRDQSQSLNINQLSLTSIHSGGAEDSGLDEEAKGTHEEEPEPAGGAKKKRKPSFQPSAYRFRQPGYNMEQEHYKQQFFDHLGADKYKISKQLVELVYVQVLGRFKKGERTVSCGVK